MVPLPQEPDEGISSSIRVPPLSCPLITLYSSPSLFLDRQAQSARPPTGTQARWPAPIPIPYRDGSFPVQRRKCEEERAVAGHDPIPIQGRAAEEVGQGQREGASNTASCRENYTYYVQRVE
jgi:hypothetical protein